MEEFIMKYCIETGLCVNWNEDTGAYDQNVSNEDGILFDSLEEATKVFDFKCEESLGKEGVYVFLSDVENDDAKILREFYTDINGNKIQKSFSDLLKKKGINAYNLSRMTGVPEQTIRDLKNGNSEFTNSKVKTALKISKALEMSIEEIVNYLM
jgi:Plasmid maintenance system antidote protein